MNEPVVAYCRVSTKQEDQLNSLATQKQFFLEYAERNKLNLTEVYADEGLSGTKKKNRKDFLRLMEDARKGLFKKVLVKDVSRLARNTVDFLESIRELKKLRIETRFLTIDPAVTGSSDSEFQLSLFAILAQEESNNTSKRVKFGKAHNAKKGKVPSFVYGFDKIEGDYFNLTVNEKEKGVIRRIFSMYVNEGYGANKIAMQLNREGLRTKRGALWSQNAIVRILTNQIYIGRVINGKQEVYDFLTGDRTNKPKEQWIITEKPELALISNEDFNEAQSILKSRHEMFKLTGEKHTNNYVFTKLIKCEHCNYSFRRVSRTYTNSPDAKTYIKWCCSSRNLKGVNECPNRTVIDEQELLKVIREYLVNLHNNKEEFINEVKREFERAYKSMHRDEETVESLTKDIRELRSRKDRHTELYAAGVYSMSELLKKVEGINGRLEELEYRLKMKKSEVSWADQMDDFYKQCFIDIDMLLNTEILTNEMLKKVISHMSVNSDGEVSVHIRQFDGV